MLNSYLPNNYCHDYYRNYSGNFSYGNPANNSSDLRPLSYRHNSMNSNFSINSFNSIMSLSGYQNGINRQNRFMNRRGRKVSFNSNVTVIPVESYKEYNIDVSIKRSFSFDSAKIDKRNNNKFKEDCGCNVF